MKRQWRRNITDYTKNPNSNPNPDWKEYNRLQQEFEEIRNLKHKEKEQAEIDAEAETLQDQSFICNKALILISN